MNNYLQPNSQTKWNLFIEMGGRFTTRYLSQHYPFNSLQIESIRKHLDWYNLSNNPCMTFKLVDTYKRKLNFSNLLINKSLVWTNELITKYDKFIDKKCHTYLDFIKKSEPKENSQNITNSKLSKFTNLSQEEIESMIMDFSDYFSIAQSKEILWNEHLLSLMKISRKKYCDFYNKKLSDNNSFEYLSNNEAVPWDNNLITKYETLVDFWNLSRNKNVIWDFDLLTRYKKKLRWDYLMESKTLEKLQWNWERFESFKYNLLEADGFFRNKYFFNNLFGCLSFVEVAEILKQMSELKSRNNKFYFIRRFFT